MQLKPQEGVGPSSNQRYHQGGGVKETSGDFAIAEDQSSIFSSDEEVITSDHQDPLYQHIRKVQNKLARQERDDERA